MQSGNLIQIKNLSCSYSYKEEDKVLFIKNLILLRGKLIFLIGASGSGKSTLLETLGLMNNTIASGTVLLINNKTTYDFAELWKSDNLEEINVIRKNFLSFIFQNTNLMDNFTAYENICLSQMIKSNANQEKAMDGAVELMKQVRLPHNEVNFETLSVNLSGGQRQRVSFVRALNTDFKVLLCDEPTGNLDQVNATELINIIKENLTNDKSAILVSHDINLALKYADQLILLTKNQEHGYGEILPENIYSRPEWESMNEIQLNNFRNSVINLFVPSLKKEENATEKSTTFAKKITYRRLFIKKEGRVLYGKSYLNLLILIAIISITFLAIGFANGALNYLDIKIHDKFVNWLSVVIPKSLSSPASVEDFTQKLNEDEARKKYLVDTVTAYKIMWLPFFQNDSTNQTQIVKGRLLTYDDPLTQHFFSKENLDKPGKNNFDSDHDLGIVITKKMLASLGYPDDAKIIYFNNYNLDTTRNPQSYFKVPVPIRAVIKEIPGKNNFLVTDFFYNSWKEQKECVFNFTGDQRKSIIFFVNGNKELGLAFKNKINEAEVAGIFDLTEYFSETKTNSDDEETQKSNHENNTIYDSIAIESTKTSSQHFEIYLSVDSPCTQINSPGSELVVEIDPIPKYYSTTEKLYNKIVNLPFYIKEKNHFIRILDYGNPVYKNEEIIYDYLSINFKNLDQIDSFSKFFNLTLNPEIETSKDEGNLIEIDTGAIKEKKNFNYISKMTLLISALLTIFSILAITLFIANLLKTHLNKVKMNIGTYKAFGLSDKESKNIYLHIMMRFIIIGLVISFALALVFGNIIGFMFENSLNIDDKPEYFRLFDTLTYALLCIIILVTIFVSYFNINKILSKTPGDLIYNR